MNSYAYAVSSTHDSHRSSKRKPLTAGWGARGRVRMSILLPSRVVPAAKMRAVMLPLPPILWKRTCSITMRSCPFRISLFSLWSTSSVLPTERTFQTLSQGLLGLGDKQFSRSRHPQRPPSLSKVLYELQKHSSAQGIVRAFSHSAKCQFLLRSLYQDVTHLFVPRSLVCHADSETAKQFGQ